VSSVAQSRCCAVPVTLLPMHVDPMQAPVFGERAVCRPGDAPKAVRPTISTASRLADGRLEKGIRKKSAQAHESGNLDGIELSEDFCNAHLNDCRISRGLVLFKCGVLVPNLVHARLNNDHGAPQTLL